LGKKLSLKKAKGRTSNDLKNMFGTRFEVSNLMEDASPTLSKRTIESPESSFRAAKAPFTFKYKLSGFNQSVANQPVDEEEQSQTNISTG